MRATMPACGRSEVEMRLFRRVEPPPELCGSERDAWHDEGNSARSNAIGARSELCIASVRYVWCTIEANTHVRSSKGCDFVRAKPFRDRTKVRLANHRPLRAELGVGLQGLLARRTAVAGRKGRDG